jgi:hypothetical protein
LAEFPHDVMDPGLQRPERAFVSLVERFESFVQDGEEGRTIYHQEVVAATAASTQREQTAHHFGSVDGGVFMPEPRREPANGWGCQGFSYCVIIRVFGEGATVGCEGGAMGMSVTTVAEHPNISVQVRGASSVQHSGAPVVRGVIRVFPGREVPVLGRVRACAVGLEDEEFLRPVLLRIEHGASDGFLEAAARDARNGFGVAQDGGEVPIGSGDAGASEAGDDDPDTIGQGAYPAEAQPDFLISRVVGAGKGEASEVPRLVEIVEDASHGAVGGSGKVDAVGG